VKLYNSIPSKAEDNLKALIKGTIPGKVGSSGLEPGSKWDWNNREVVCLRPVKLTHLALLLLSSFRTTMSLKRSKMVENPLLELLKLIPASGEGLPPLIIIFDEGANLCTDGINARIGSGEEQPHTSFRRMMRGLRHTPYGAPFSLRIPELGSFCLVSGTIAPHASLTGA